MQPQRAGPDSCDHSSGDHQTPHYTIPDQPPVTLIWRLTLGRLWRRSMMKSWPLGFNPMARSNPAESSSSLAAARRGFCATQASFWARQEFNAAVQVARIPLQELAEINLDGA